MRDTCSLLSCVDTARRRRLKPELAAGPDPMSSLQSGGNVCGSRAPSVVLCTASLSTSWSTSRCVSLGPRAGIHTGLLHFTPHPPGLTNSRVFLSFYFQKRIRFLSVYVRRDTCRLEPLEHVSEDPQRPSRKTPLMGSGGTRVQGTSGLPGVRHPRRSLPARSVAWDPVRGPRASSS